MSFNPSPDRPLSVACPSFSHEEQERILFETKKILNGMLSMGENVAEFEKRFSEYCRMPFGVAFPSCTAALEASLKVLGIGPGDEVIVPVQTFFATGAAVENTGATTVFAEVLPESFALDLEDVMRRITSRTRAVIWVHFGGWIDPSILEAVNQLRKKGIHLIEDAAHAHGAELEGKRAGSFGAIGCFSFYPTKIMTTGEGGMAVTADETLNVQLKSLQNRGKKMDTTVEVYSTLGRNDRFTEVAAVMGLSQLRELDTFISNRRTVASEYTRLLAGVDGVEPLPGMREGNASFWRYACRIKRKIDRNDLQKKLKNDQITVDWPYDPPLHLQPYFVQKYGFKQGSRLRSEEAMQSHFCLPMHAKLLPEDVAYIVKKLSESIG